MRVAVITGITGGFDVPKDMPRQHGSSGYELSFHLFTEKDFKDDIAHLNDRTKALYFKTQMHYMVDADIYIWLDGKIQVLKHDFIASILLQIRFNSFAMLKHGERKCIYEEVDYIEQQIVQGSEYLRARYAHRPLRQEVERYRAAGYPPNRGLNDCSIFAWRNTDSMRAIFDEWWKVVSDEKTFDQTAIQYICWSKGMHIIPLVFKPGSFKLIKHLKVC